MNLGRLFRVLGDRYKIVLLILAVTVFAAGIASLLISKRYTASTSIIVEFPSNDPLNGNPNYMAGTVAGFLATQVDLIKSDRVIGRVAQALSRNPEPLLREWASQGGSLTDPGATQAMMDWLGTKLSREMRVEASRDSSFLTISYEARDAEFAALAANAFSKAYLAAMLELKTEPAKNYSTLFEGQLKQYRQDLAAAQEKLSRFQQKSGIITSDEREDVENRRLQELSTQLVQIQNEMSDSRSRRQTAQRGSTEALPEVISNQLIQSMKSELSRVEARYNDESSRYGANHPQLLATKAEMNSLRSRLEAETGRIVASITAGNSINEQREARIRSALDAQRSKVLQLRQQRDQLALLQRDVDAAQKAYDLLSGRLTQTNLESAARLSNASIASPATVPSDPSRPKLGLNLGLGAFFGLLLGVLAAVMAEGLQRPLRTAEDLLEAAGVPVLAVLPPANSRRVHRLVGDTGPTVGPQLRLGNR